MKQDIGNLIKKILQDYCVVLNHWSFHCIVLMFSIHLTIYLISSSHADHFVIDNDVELLLNVRCTA